MACVASDGEGKWRILFVGPDGRRYTIRLGECAEDRAKAVNAHVDELLYSKKRDVPLTKQAAAWVRGLPGTIRNVLERAELIEKLPEEKDTAAAACPALAAWCQSYIGARTDVKPAMKIKLELTRDKMVRCWGAGRPIDTITAGDAKEFLIYLKTRKASEAYQRRVCGLAKQFFNHAVEKELINRNPFTVAKIKTGNKANKSREYFVSEAEARVVLDSCPDHQWRLIFALCRYGGLRCPSEVLRLKWEDINWATARFTVHASKTEHHEDGGIRVVPIFPELAAHLQETFEKAIDPETLRPADDYVITSYRLNNLNLRTQFRRILKRAGLKPWPRIFQNLRSTRETELLEHFPVNVVCEWIGNTPDVAKEHYLQKAREDHFQKAAGNLAQIPAQYGPVSEGMDGDAPDPAHKKSPVSFTVRGFANSYDNKELAGLGAGGFEPPKA